MHSAYSSDLSAMFLLERQHNKLESAYYWLFWYNIYSFPLFVYWNTKSYNNYWKRGKLSVILVKSQSWSFRYNLKKIREYRSWMSNIFFFVKISLETWGYLLLWREHPAENWLTIAKVGADGKKLSTQGKMSCPQSKMSHVLYYRTTVILVQFLVWKLIDLVAPTKLNWINIDLLLNMCDEIILICGLSCCEKCAGQLHE